MTTSLHVVPAFAAPQPATTKLATSLALPELPRPLGLIAELTYRCPLHCPYCSNPVHYPGGMELSMDEWTRVFNEAASTGVLHALLTGGEPLTRSDLASLVTAARSAGLYTNLITSAVGLTRHRIEELRTAGLDSVQISFQSDVAHRADPIAGASAHALKWEAAQEVTACGLPLTINVVLHRANIDRVDAMISLAESLGASRLELAHTQFYGWAFRNRANLIPLRHQIEQTKMIAEAAQQRLRGVMQILYVMPDYFADRPKPCMNGWGRRYLTVNPVGDVLPCPTAFEIPGMRFDNIRTHPLQWIWTNSEAFNRFRGTAWMPEPCQSCERRDIDFGGCRCQSALLTGDAGRADPACALSPDHARLTDWVAHVDSAERSESTPLVPRSNPH